MVCWLACFPQDLHIAGGGGVDTIKLLFTASLNTQQNVVRKHWFAKNRGNSINGVMASILASGVVNR